MARARIKLRGATAAWALGTVLVAAQFARAEGPQSQPSPPRPNDFTPAALQQAGALIEKYVRPIGEPAPTLAQKRAIESAIILLKSGQGAKEKYAIERFLEIGPAALRDLGELAASARREQPTGDTAAGASYSAIMAAIIIQRIEAAQRQPILEELLPLSDEANAVLLSKLRQTAAAAMNAEERLVVATAALNKASANTALDAPAVAGERKALAEAQAAEKQILARQDMLIKLKRLIAPKPFPASPAPTAPTQPPPQPATLPADVMGIQTISGQNAQAERGTPTAPAPSAAPTEQVTQSTTPPANVMGIQPISPPAYDTNPTLGGWTSTPAGVWQPVPGGYGPVIILH
jgi:hypothetical protein